MLTFLRRAISREYVWPTVRGVLGAVGIVVALVVYWHLLNVPRRMESAMYTGECRGWLSRAHTPDDTTAVYARHPAQDRVRLSCAYWLTAP